MTIGNRISKLRKEYSYSQEYIATQLGVSRQAVSKWETDQTAPDTYNLIALAELFNVSVEYLATGKKPEVVQPEAETNKNYGTRKIIGFILLGVGLVTTVLGLILFAELLFLAAAFIVAGILCIAVKKHFVITIICVFAVLFALFGSFFTGYGAAAFTVLNTILIIFVIIIIAKVVKKVLHK